jgi:hypothetical protein
MLGEMIAKSSGKLTGVKVLPSEGPVPKLEVALQGTGKLLGQAMTEFITYWQTVRPDGELYGEGQVVMMTQAGDIVTWKGFGVGRPTGQGFAASYHVAGAHQTISEKLRLLNSVVRVIDYELDADGNYTYKEWEWK